MSTLEKIKADYLAARKSKTATVSLLSTLVGDLQKIEKDTGSVTEERVISLLKKYRESTLTVIQYTTVGGSAREQAVVELEAIESYLPKQLTNEQLKQTIRDAVSSGAKTLGDIMKHLKTTVPGLYDGKMAQEAARTILEENIE